MFPSFFILALWELYKIFNHYPTDLLFRESINIHWQKMGLILLTMAKEFFNFQNWSLLWIIFLASLILSWKKIGRVKLFFLVFCTQWLSYFAVYIVTPGDPIYRVEGTIDRLYLHLAPLAILMIGLLLESEFSVFNKLLSWRKRLQK